MPEVDLKFTELSPPETSRKYHFVGGVVELKNVVRVCVRPSGSHRLETADGKKWIIPTGWIAIELEMDSWTF